MEAIKIRGQEIQVDASCVNGPMLRMVEERVVSQKQSALETAIKRIKDLDDEDLRREILEAALAVESRAAASPRDIKEFLSSLAGAIFIVTMKAREVFPDITEGEVESELVRQMQEEARELTKHG